MVYFLLHLGMSVGGLLSVMLVAAALAHLFRGWISRLL